MSKYVFQFYFVLISSLVSAQVPKYAEMYRPQFHPSASVGFMGDPNGPIKFQGKYHLFWWGHLRSDDLVYWEEINRNALNGTPAGFGNWSGSVVVDVENTSGFGSPANPPMIAVYTLHENATGIQRQAISTSLTYGSFDFYEGNPVINSTSHDFRDPQVFWHDATAKWVMVITKPVDRAVEIYSSSDLKAWTYESAFTDRGAKKEVWEVPDLFQLPVNEDLNNKKWVMTCGMGPNKMQFWVGNFDGHQFTLDDDENLVSGAHVQGDVFTDFENSFDGWTIEGTAFGSGPTTTALPDQQAVYGFTGNGYANSYHGGDASTGKMTSPEFIISKRHINFQIGGGTSSATRLVVVVDGQAVATISPTTNQETLRWRGVDVSSWIGKTAHIEIVDEATTGWGHTLVDQIVFSDILYDTRIENANWADWGADFYAAKSFRNYDNDDSRTIWLAWMANWVYARDVPTTPWKGFQTVPRKLTLIKEDQGYQLVQTPINEISKLRNVQLLKNNFTVSGTQSFGFSPEWNVYELKVKFRVRNKDQNFGINLAEANGQKIVVSYNASTSNLSVSRPVTHFTFNGFSRESKAPVTLAADSILDLHIFLDQSSIEVFANHYKTTISSLAFTNVNETAVSLFSNAGSVEVVELSAWDLKSIWGITAEEMEKPDMPPVTETEKESALSSIYPNPVRRGEELNVDIQGKFEVLSLYDIWGKKHEFTQGSTGSRIQLSSSLNTGLYLLCIRSGNKNRTIKLIVE
jgi:fructan beta-fructosidase